MVGYILAAVLGAAAIVVGILLARSRKQQAQVEHARSELEQRVTAVTAQLARYQAIVDVEAEVEATRKRLEAEQQEAQAVMARYRAELGETKAAAETSLAQTRREEALVRASLEQLRAELAYLDDQAMFAAHGLYESRYDFGTAEELATSLSEIRNRQKSMIKEGLAAVCRTTWTVAGSESKGRKMVQDNIKLMLRAFNGECDAAVTQVKYNNIESLVNRVTKAHEAINKLGSVNQCEITDTYLQFKISELELAHAHKERLQAEKEEQRLIREQMREDERAAREIEAAQKAAEADEEKLAKAIAKAQQQAEQAAGVRHDQLMSKVAELQQQLAEAATRRERAISRAQLTRSGHVYVISNVGSFGEHIYKIGMTRRLEPLDRVRELGDASVPFQFDVHAMIYTEDAPKLEAELQRRFSAFQVNLVNNRKEFFQVSLEHIEAAVAQMHGRISFVRTAAAEEFRKSQALRQRRAHHGEVQQPEAHATHESALGPAWAAAPA